VNKFTQSQLNILDGFNNMARPFPPSHRRLKAYIETRQRREALHRTTTPLDRVRAYVRDHEALRSGRVIAFLCQFPDGEGELTVDDLKAVLRLVP
jgi:hypothetical protein